MHAVAPSDDQGATVTVAVQLARGRLAPVRRPKELKRGKRRPRALGRVQKNRRPRVKTERLAQRKAPKVGAMRLRLPISRNCAKTMHARRTETSLSKRWYGALHS